ncbi:MAG TPA: MetQ/NlpA family ABC transporter substrate-binding protein [Syntrophorhabdaceae bacterium]|nr:MetQ/NlpA family ABC transporter substrate-binding protein [Syntrophorhabdaceae bacterium]
MHKKSLSIMFMLLIFTLFVTGLQIHAAPAEKKSLKLGCLAPTQPMVQWIKEGLSPLGYSVEILMFDANQLPATALKDGSVDGIIANHRQWVLTFNKESNANLEMVKPYLFHSFYAIYSVKYKKLTDIPRNAQIVIPGDPTNLSRSLLILKDAGLITLGEKNGPFYTTLDVKDNPKKIKLIEAEITQTARSIQDVDAVIATAFHAASTGKIDPRNVLFEDRQNKEYPLGLIVRSEDLNAQWIKDAVKIYRSKAYRTKFTDTFKNTYWLFD